VRTVASVDTSVSVLVVKLVQPICKGEEDEKPDHQKLGNIEQHSPERDLNRTHVHVRVEKINLNFVLETLFLKFILLSRRKLKILATEKSASEMSVG